APKPPNLRAVAQHLDAGPGGPGLPRQGLDPTRAQPRGHPPGHPPPGSLLAAGQALDHQPRPSLRTQETGPRPPDPPRPDPPRLGPGLPGRVLVVASGPARSARLERRRPAALAGTGPAPRRPGPQGLVLLWLVSHRHGADAAAFRGRP